MSNWIEALKERFAPVEKLSPGFYSYTAPPNDPYNYRLHLRVEADGRGILIVNGSTVLHLNDTATEYAYHLVKNTPVEQVAEQMAARYRVSKRAAGEDFADLRERIGTLIATPDLDPISYLDFDRHEPYPEDLSAPYRLDCALTYRLPRHADPAAAPTKRVDRELSTEEWKAIIDKAWAAGIPHLIFTGGEPTLRDDLAELLQHAEDLGQVTGLLTDGIKLADANYLNSLLQAGLDHATIILQPEEGKSWEALASFSYWSEVLDEDIFVAVHLTLTKENASQATQLLDRLATAGVSAVSLSASDPALADELQAVRAYADRLDLSLVWDLPVPYSSINPVALELAEQDKVTPEGAGCGWLYVEPDGDVLPEQGMNEVLGNLAKESWESIWEKAKARKS